MLETDSSLKSEPIETVCSNELQTSEGSGKSPINSESVDSSKTGKKRKKRQKLDIGNDKNVELSTTKMTKDSSTKKTKKSEVPLEESVVVTPDSSIDQGTAADFSTKNTKISEVPLEESVVVTPDSSIEQGTAADAGNWTDEIPGPSKQIDWDDMPTWLEEFINYNYYCPMDHCFKPFFKSNTLVLHMKRCVKKSSDYCTKKIKCPECGFNTNVKDFGNHLRSKHILLYWYLAELEDGHWVICQNYKCAKYMEDIGECVSHFRRCDYLWKCKYCEIEYDEEKKVERHHCHTTSEEESDSESGNDENDDNDKDNPNDKNTSNDNNTPKNNDSKDNDNKSKNKSDNDKIDRTSVKRKRGRPKKNASENINQSNKNVYSDSDNEVNIGSYDSNMSRTVKIEENFVEGKIDQVKVKKKSKKVESREKKIEKVVKTIKDNITKKSGLAEETLLKWTERFKRFYFVCPVNNCSYTAASPQMLCSHLKSCKLLKEELDISVVSNQIESLMLNCPFDFCKKRTECLQFVDYIRHIVINHKLVLYYIKIINTGGEAVCSNFRCAENIKTPEESMYHYQNCKYLWQCDSCHIEYKCEVSVKTHNCEMKKVKLKEEKEDIGEGGKKRRKSAKRAIGIISELANSIKEKKRHEGEDGKEDGSGKKEDVDDDYDAPSRGSSSTEDSDSGESESSASLDADADDEIEVDVNERQPKLQRNKCTLRYNTKYFKQWLRENVSKGSHLVKLMPENGNVKFLSESEWEIPTATLPEIEVQYYAEHTKKKMVEMSMDKNNSMLPLAGSSTISFFAGGPIYAMEWCPLPKEESRQYIAVTTHTSYGETHCISDVKETPGCIQLWYVGKLSSKHSQNPPQLSMGICHRFGPVYDIKWYPYGYSKQNGTDGDESARLGLLAVACGDGKVRIYSIPQPSKIPRENSVYVRMEASATLIPHKSNAFESHRTGVCLCVAWSPRLHSTKIAAGYGDGGVRIWDVDTKSVLLHVTDLNTSALLPVVTVDAHSFAVKSLAWCPYRDGVIVSVSSDKSLKVYDIAQPYNPLFVIKRGSFTDVEWPIARFSLLFSEDDSFNIWPGSARNFVLEKSLEEKPANPEKCGPHATTRHNAAVLSISYNNMLDLVATSDVAGEVIVSKDQDVTGSKIPTFVRKIEPVYRIERTELKPEDDKVSSGEENADQPDVECINVVDEYSKRAGENKSNFHKYRYKFVDSNKFEFSMRRSRDDADVKRFRRTENLSTSNVTKYETRAVHKVSWNPNPGCYTWLASGTRLGIVRLHNFAAWKNACKV